MAVLEFKSVDLIFGRAWQEALCLVDEGAGREAVLEKTGAVVGVHDANLAIEEGEICVLMGLSGSGKSSLLRCINGLNPITRGELLIDDGGHRIDIASCDAATLRRLRTDRIAMVFQQFALMPWRTVAENVGFGLELKGVSKVERTARVAEKLDLVGLSQWRDKYAHELSGGMQQRVGLARAFATDGDILLMDEPFSALDPLIRQHLQDELMELQQRLKKTIVFVSHDLDEAMKIGSHIAIMESGRIVQYGRPEEIALNPANDYVARFVAHMNPMNVLRGGSLMTPLAALAETGGALRLGAGGRVALRLSADRRPERLTLAGETVTLRHWDGSGEGGAAAWRDSVVAASADITMGEAILIRHMSGNPVLLVEDGQMIGVVGDEEIYRGLLRQTGKSEGGRRDANRMGDNRDG
ncbi:choline ABC transporter ATP-binding protein [Oceanibacterium hippocampi]|uniref:Trimethylamine N-oxide transport system ATP-binding protein TmoW n=1 Tax=Oceanibacterium hippocampi TaxID=745714 RepID=A0A1Y5SFK7_9PROT|nr:choline ABC transporter ATP-binding protein [Oceanibacterium hippocampi]SLN36836.1 Glycine betaine/L-proline transport ATP-binding protein ProV [Oceanibacterium hippocampi]